MPTYDASSASCLVFTYKEGLLSRVAHDLKFEVRSFTVDFDGESVQASFDPRSVTCLCAMKRGRENPRALSASDIDKIHENMHRDVLQPSEHPTIRFTSDRVERQGSQLRIAGQLELHGQTHAVRANAALVGGQWEAEITLHQPTWGIKPFTAVMGTLKVKPDVMVRIRVPAR